MTTTRTAAVTFSTRQFEFSHGSKPKGQGFWAFQVGGETLFFEGTLTQAKAQATKAAKAAGVRQVEVLP